MVSIIAAVVLASGTLGAPEVTVNRTVQYVRNLRPDMPVAKARQLGRQIATWAKFQGVKPRLLAAIIRRESNFRSGLKSCWTVKLRRGRTRFTCDLGIAQVNQLWVDKWKLDADRLQNEDSYNIAVAARVLGWVKKYFGDDPNWYARYHSGTPSLKREYAAQVGTYLAME
jgi:soluble lytic murein transglycosylase-like protein